MASSKEATLDLNGWDESIIDFREVEWDYYWNEFLPVNTKWHQPNQKVFSGSVWPQSGKNGYASYRLRIKGIKKSKKILELRIPPSGLAHRAFLIPENDPSNFWSASSGRVSSVPENELASKKFSSIIFTPSTQTDYILIVYVSNHTDLQGGLWSSPKLGLLEDISGYYSTIHSFNLITLSVMGSLSIYLFMIWYRRRSSLTPLYLSISGLFSVVRIICLDHRVIGLLSDDYYQLVRTLEYVTIPGAGLYFLLFLKSAFPETKLPRFLLQPTIYFSQILLIVSLFTTDKAQSYLLPILQLAAFVQFALDGAIVYQAVTKRLLSSHLALLGYLTIL